MQPLLIHHHLPKTAGSSLREVVRANLPGELFYGDPPQLTAPNLKLKDLSDTASYRMAFVGSWHDWYASRTPDERARLRCVGSHTAQCLIPSVHDRPVRPFTVLRDPVDRAVSTYHYSLERWERSRREGMRAKAEAEGIIGRTLHENRWSLADVYRELGGDSSFPGPAAFSRFFNGQTREILFPYPDSTELPFSTGGAEFDDCLGEALEILSTYVVGTQDRFSESVRLFADSFGWSRAFVTHRNASSGRTEIDEQTRSLIQAHNSIDVELHAYYSARLDGLPGIGFGKNARERARSAAGRARRAARTRLARAVQPTQE